MNEAGLGSPGRKTWRWGDGVRLFAAWPSTLFFRGVGRLKLGLAWMDRFQILFISLTPQVRQPLNEPPGQGKPREAADSPAEPQARPPPPAHFTFHSPFGGK